jgi:hypothetical protein
VAFAIEYRCSPRALPRDAATRLLDFSGVVTTAQLSLRPIPLREPSAIQSFHRGTSAIRDDDCAAVQGLGLQDAVSLECL